MKLDLLLAVQNSNPLEMEGWAAGLFTFVLGMIVVFLGITIIVLFVSLAGYIFNAKNKKDAKTKEAEEENIQMEETSSVDEEIPEDVRVAIIAAIAAYYDGEKPQNSFTVRKIKKLR